MKKVLFASALILCLFVSCKKNGAVENPVQEESSGVAAVEESKNQVSVEEKEPEKSDGENLSVYQKNGASDQNGDNSNGNYPWGSEKRAGEYSVVDGRTVIIKQKKVVLTQSVKFYKAPDVNSETQASEIYEYILRNEPNWKETDMLLKGTVLDVYARTENPETIDGVTSCWYYTSMPTVAEYNQYGWFFGGYFVDYEESKSGEYSEILRDPFGKNPGQFDFPKTERTDLSDSSSFEVHELEAYLDFDEEDDWGIKVYHSPALEKEVYTVQKGDHIKVYGYVTMRPDGKTSVEVETSGGVYGFIKIRNPYKDGNFLPESWMNLDGKRVEMVRLFSSFGLSDNADLRCLPTENSESVSGFTPGEYYESTVITSDYEWVLIISGDFAAWVRVKDLYRDQGGPMILTPETNLIWELINSNMI